MSAVPLMKLHNPVRGSSDARDSDQMSDEEDDPLESVLARMKYRPNYYRSHDFWSSTLFTGALCLVVGFVVSYVTFISMGRNKRLLLSVSHDANPDVASAILNQVVPTHIDAYLRDLNGISSANGSQTQAQLLLKHFTELGFDSVSSMSSVVLMSYFDKTRPNKVSIMKKNSEVQSFKCIGNSYLQIPDGLAVSKSVEGVVVYINFGHDSDFQYLKKMNIPVEGCIVLARLGRMTPVDLVDSALKRGVKGVILFADSQQFPNSESSTEPILWPSQLGILQNLHGDPSTLKTRGVVHGVDRSKVGCVPVQIISATNAQDILKQMLSNNQSHESWMENMNIANPIITGISSQDFHLEIEINVVNIEKEFINVVAAIKGHEEPDRYVLLGSDRDLLVGSSSHSLEGTASLMELARILGGLRKTKNWSPRRTVVFCSWGVTQSQGYFHNAPLVGDWTHLLDSRAVAYLNIDMTKSGKANFSAHGTPLLSHLLCDASALVPSPSPDAGKSTVYDEWLQMPSNTSSPSHLLVNAISPEEDLQTLLQNLGIPSLHFQLGNEKFLSNINLSQNKLSFYKATVQLWGILAWMLADSLVLPFNVQQYATFLVESITMLEAKYEITITNHSLPLDHLADAIRNFSEVAATFQKRLLQVNKANNLETRIMNDQLIHLEKAFLHQSSNKAMRHIVLAPGAFVSNNASVGFGALQDMLDNINTSPIAVDLRATMGEHIMLLAHCIKSATSVLQDPLQPLAFNEL